MPTARNCSSVRARERPGGDAVWHQRDQTAVDRRCGFGRELLAGDGANERGEMIGALRGRKAARRHAA